MTTIPTKTTTPEPTREDRRYRLHFSPEVERAMHHAAIDLELSVHELIVMAVREHIERTGWLGIVLGQQGASPPK